LKKNRLAILLIIIVAAAAVIGFIWWYIGRTPERERERYSKFGFSFEYPQGMEISEVGLEGEGTATSSSGALLGDLTNDDIEFIKLSWQTIEPAPELEDSLNKSFQGIEAEGAYVEKGQLVTSAQVDGHDMIYQYFTASVETLTFYGITGVWYCDTNNKSYEFILMHTQQDVLPKFQQYINSFACF
jgi:hypothetical protein